MTGGGVMGRPPLVPSVADGRHIPERDEQHREDAPIEDEEDTMDRWVGVAVMGVLLLVEGLAIYEFLLHTTLPPGGITVVLGLAGVGELVVSTFLAFVFHPPSILWVAVASFFTIATGVVVGIGGLSAVWTAIGVLLAAGVLFAALAAWRLVVTWRTILREDRASAPS